tara:strand:+ start:1242 stop:1754 length:513 start_codon:yes stop_codon:yes gene_type:complete
MNHLMIDLETLGTAETSIFITCGACYFDPDTGEIGRKFYSAIDIQSSIDVGRTFSASTLKWWMGQGEDAKKQFEEEGASLQDFLKQFGAFAQDATVWGNGATFDISMLENAYGEGNQPWRFWNVRDCRTVEWLSKLDRGSFERKGVHHNALDDAIYQAEYISAMIQDIRI